MYKIVNKKRLNPTVTLMDIEAPLVARKAEAGQFIILRVSEDGDDILMESIEDDDEFEKVEEYFNDLFFSEVDYDEE